MTVEPTPPEPTKASKEKLQQKRSAEQIFMIAGVIAIAGLVMIFLGKWIGWLTVILALPLVGVAIREWLIFKRMPE
jgi:multidrug efflux pump subunit AcrB